MAFSSLGVHIRPYIASQYCFHQCWRIALLITHTVESHKKMVPSFAESKWEVLHGVSVSDPFGALSSHLGPHLPPTSLLPPTNGAPGTPKYVSGSTHTSADVHWTFVRMSTCIQVFMKAGILSTWLKVFVLHNSFYTSR
jgi:hypothetical protein